jgi:hypothetical protein
MIEASAREALAEMAQGRTQDEYVALVWSQRYPHASPAASTGWPYRASTGVMQHSKLRKIT